MLSLVAASAFTVAIKPRIEVSAEVRPGCRVDRVEPLELKCVRGTIYRIEERVDPETGRREIVVVIEY